MVDLTRRDAEAILARTMGDSGESAMTSKQLKKDIIELSTLAKQIFRDKSRPDEYDRLVEEVKQGIAKTTRVPANIFHLPGESPHEARLRSRYLLFIEPSLFSCILKKWPGHFENIVGSEYMAFPAVLRSAMQAGEEISNCNHLRNIENVADGLPSIFIPFLRVIEAQIHYPWDEFQDELDAFKESVQLLCDKGATVNDRSPENGCTLLYMTFHELSEPEIMRRIVSLLLDMGALPDAPCDFTTGNTSLHESIVKFGDYVDLATIETLLRYPKPIDLGALNHWGDTPLDTAIIQPNVTIEVIQAYLDRNLFQQMEWSCRNILEINYYQRPPLCLLAHRGVRTHFEDMSDMLIRNGASVCVPVVKCAGRYLMSDEGRPLYDVIIKNEEGDFSQRVVSYYRRKKRELKIV